MNFFRGFGETLVMFSILGVFDKKKKKRPGKCFMIFLIEKNAFSDYKNQNLKKLENWSKFGISSTFLFLTK